MAHRWGGWPVVEKYPSVLPWTLPEPSERFVITRGTVKCRECRLIAPHTLSWPGDAYFTWNIKGHTLWAYNMDHARVLLEFLASKERDETKYPGYERSLRKLPSEVISAKARDLVAKEISSTLDKLSGPDAAQRA